MKTVKMRVDVCTYSPNNRKTIFNGTIQIPGIGDVYHETEEISLNWLNRLEGGEFGDLGGKADMDIEYFDSETGEFLDDYFIEIGELVKQK